MSVVNHSLAFETGLQVHDHRCSIRNVARKTCLPNTPETSIRNSDRTRYVGLVHTPLLLLSQTRPAPAPPCVDESFSQLPFCQNELSGYLLVTDVNWLPQMPPCQSGSMNTGYVTVASARNAGSGVMDSSLPDTSTGITACRRMPPWSAESHINGAGATNTARPCSSRASAPPPAVATTVRSFVDRPNLTVRSAGFAAAALVLTTSTSAKPLAVAVTRRSTSGSTPA